MIDVDWDRLYYRCCIWVEFPVQRRLCPIFVRNVGSPDIHECFRGLTGSQRTPRVLGRHTSDINSGQTPIIYFVDNPPIYINWADSDD